MPKKRHQARYSKPQSTAPASLNPSSASRSSTTDPNAHPARGVNEILADLRRSNPQPGLVDHSSQDTRATPSLPPALRQILQLPETPAPRPRRPVRVDQSGRRLPPGPPPPRSGFIQSKVIWLSSGTEHATAAGPETESDGRRRRRQPHVGVAFPNTYTAARGSLVDLALRRMAQDWEFQKSYNRYYLHGLPGRLRSSLVGYLGVCHEPGVGVADLRALLLAPPEVIAAVCHERGVSDWDEQDHNDQDGSSPSSLSSSAAVAAEASAVGLANIDFSYLDLAGSVGRSITVAELAGLLFPPPPETSANSVQDSWDTPAPVIASMQLVPSLTHLSLALRRQDQQDASSPFSSSSRPWKQLLTLAAKLPTLTHLSLAGWPEPSYTPNAKYSSVVSAQGRTVQYGGTGPYSHSLDDDWFEAVAILRTLSRHLYGLEYLDLTGCEAWFPALAHEAEGRCIDWATHWGKVTTLVLKTGTGKESGSSSAFTAPTTEVITSIEKHIIAQRAGKGRFITVVRDDHSI